MDGGFACVLSLYFYNGFIVAIRLLTINGNLLESCIHYTNGMLQV